MLLHAMPALHDADVYMMPEEQVPFNILTHNRPSKYVTVCCAVYVFEKNKQQQQKETEGRSLYMNVAHHIIDPLYYLSLESLDQRTFAMCVWCKKKKNHTRIIRMHDAASGPLNIFFGSDIGICCVRLNISNNYSSYRLIEIVFFPL